MAALITLGQGGVAGGLGGSAGGGGSATFSGALVKKALDQAAADYTTITPIAFDEEVYDTDGYHDNVTNNSRLTIPTTGYYRLTGQVGIGAFSTSLWAQVSFLKDGASMDPAILARNEISAPDEYSQFISPVLALTAGNYVQMALQVETDTSVTIQELYTLFSIERVG